LGGDVYWLSGSTPISEQGVTARGSPRGIARLPLATLASPSPCDDAVDVVLELEQKLFGTVSDAEGKPLAQPVVFVLEESGPADRRLARLLATADGDESGRYEIADLAARTYLVRACQGTAGCAEARAAPGPDSVDFRVKAKGVF